MSIIQGLIVAFALFAITRTITQFKKGGLTIAWLLFWVVFWIAASVVTLLPQTSDVLARLVGVGRGADLIIYLSIIGLFFLVFRMFVKMEAIEQEITKLVRKLAIEEVDEEIYK